MKPPEINTGVHTYSVGTTITSKQYYKIKDSLQTDLRLTQANYWKDQERYTSELLKDHGIWIYLSKLGTIYRVKIRIEPCRVLEFSSSAALYQADQKSYKAMIKRIDQLLKPYHIPCSVDQMKISQEDLTCNLSFPDSAQVHLSLHALQKAFVLPHYKRDFFHKDDKKVKDYKEANQHSYKQKCRSAAFFAYDKTAQLQMIKRLSKDLISNHTLRL